MLLAKALLAITIELPNTLPRDVNYKKALPVEGWARSISLALV